MKRTLAVLLVSATLSARCADESPSTENASGGTPDNPLVGAWQAVEVTTEDSTGAPTTVPSQPALRIFTSGHYSVLGVNSAEPRPLLPDSNATDAELIAAWGPFTANSGAYEVRSDTLITHPSVAKNPNVMAPGYFARSVFRVQGDTLWLTGAGNSVNPSPANPTTGTWVRVE